MKSFCGCGVPLRFSALCLAMLATPGLLSATTVNCLQNVCDLGSLGASGSTASFINSAGDVTGISDVGTGSSLQHTFLYLSGTDFLTDIDSTSSFSNPTGLDANGDVSGTADNQAFFYNGVLNNGSLTPLGTLAGGFLSLGNGMNASGTVVGESVGSQNLPFSWSNGVMTQISALSAFSASADAELINNEGDIVGTYNAGSGQSDALFLSYAGALHSGITIVGDTVPQAMNATGQAVGFSYLGAGNDGNSHAFLYSPQTGVSDLGTLLGYNGNSDALAINDAGVVVGESDVSSTANHAFMFAGTVMQDIGELGLADSTAVAINDLGEIVGTASNAPLSDNPTLEEPFIYVDGTMTNLNEFLPANSGFTRLLTATGINDSGQIIGEGLTTGGVEDGYILNYSADPPATPEPSTLVTMALGLLLCVAGGWSRKRSERDSHRA